MRIELRGRAGIRSEALRGYTERRLRFAVGRFASRIERLTARVADVNGPKGGVDKSCRLAVRLAAGGELRVEERDLDLYVAVDRATERLGRALAREIERRRDLLPEPRRVSAGSRWPRLLGFGLGLSILASSPAWAEGRWRLDLEGAAAWQTRNQFAIPGDTGTRVSLEDYASGPVGAWRATLFWDVSRRSSLRLVAAPLGLDVDFTPSGPVEFQGRTFAAGQPTHARYEFNSYRLSWFRRFPSSGAWSFRAGVTAKVRNARIALSAGALTAEKTNTGPVPLLYGGVRYSPRERLALDLDVDGLGAPQGYAIDLTLRAETRLSKRAAVFVGYRFLDGGADNDEVYTFATFHYATAGLVLRF